MSEARWEFHVLSEAWYGVASLSDEYSDEISICVDDDDEGKNYEFALRWYKTVNGVRFEVFDDAWTVFSGNRKYSVMTKMLKAMSSMKNPTVAEMKAMLLDCGMTDATERNFRTSKTR